jgi:ABC-type transporter Mla subunit MlaD
MFDAKTRPAAQNNLAGFADALAARGSSLNDAIATLPPLFQHLQPVAGYLSNPHTQLSRFLAALNGLFQTLEPVSSTAAKLSGDQATTFQAISQSPTDLEQTIRFSSPTLDVSTASLKVQQPFLADLATFGRYLAPATAELGAALPNIDPALEAGTKVLPRTPSLDTKLQAVLAALKSLALDPGTNLAVNGLTSTVTTMNPTTRYLGPFATVCNYFNYASVGFADVASQPTDFGMAQRGLAVFGNSQTDGVQTLGATQPANGYLPGDSPGKLGFADAEYLHGPPYAAAIDNQGNADCEAGQRGYPVKLNYGDPRGRSLDTDNHTPGNQGPTWTGLSRVPAGETYSRNPITGPQIPYNPSNP